MGAAEVGVVLAAEMAEVVAAAVVVVVVAAAGVVVMAVVVVVVMVMVVGVAVVIDLVFRRFTQVTVRPSTTPHGQRSAFALPLLLFGSRLSLLIFLVPRESFASSGFALLNEWINFDSSRLARDGTRTYHEGGVLRLGHRIEPQDPHGKWFEAEVIAGYASAVRVHYRN
jgi:hypothetical protein